jgi:SnoaL-like domain
MTSDDQMQQLLNDVQYLKDRQAILDLVMRHARGHDRHDAEMMNGCFWEDGVDEHGQFVTPGPEYGATANGWHSGGFLGHNHNIMNHTCEIDGDTAHCESYVISTMLPKHTPGRAVFTAGRYVDRMEKRDGEWRILVRRTVIDQDLEGESQWPQGDLAAAFPRGAWDHSDVSYALPLELTSPSPRWDGTTR